MSAGELVPNYSNDRTPAFLVFDTESVPDGRLLQRVKYPDDDLTPEEAVCRAQEETRQRSADGSDFLPVTFQYPVAVCMITVGADYRLRRIRCLGTPDFRVERIVRDFWKGIEHHCRAQMVTFNGRCFDLPLLEMAAFRYGCSGTNYFQNKRNRYHGNHIDMMDWLSNYGACRMTGGLNLLSKILGKPGKMEVNGQQVYQLYLQGKVREMNDYCMFDTLDTYFVFLRTRVLLGQLTLEQEKEVVDAARDWLTVQVAETPALQQYLDNWGDWDPWP
jgi:predicted PolB exonuclease-like 3'-5' exonuclease